MQNRIQWFWGLRLTVFALEWTFLALSDTADSRKPVALPQDPIWSCFGGVQMCAKVSKNKKNPRFNEILSTDLPMCTKLGHAYFNSRFALDSSAGRLGQEGRRHESHAHGRASGRGDEKRTPNFWRSLIRNSGNSRLPRLSSNSQPCSPLHRDVGQTSPGKSPLKMIEGPDLSVTLGGNL